MGKNGDLLDENVQKKKKNPPKLQSANIKKLNIFTKV